MSLGSLSEDVSSGVSYEALLGVFIGDMPRGVCLGELFRVGLFLGELFLDGLFLGDILIGKSSCDSPCK